MGEVVEDEVMVSPGASLSAADRTATKSSAATDVLMLDALKALRHWASKKCPCGPPDYEVDEPKVCPLCRADVDDPNTWCMAVESTIPRHLLKAMDAAISKATGEQP